MDPTNPYENKKMSKARALALAGTLKRWLVVASFVGFGTFSGLAAFHQVSSTSTSTHSSSSSQNSSSSSSSSNSSTNSSSSSGSSLNQSGSNNFGIEQFLVYIERNKRLLEHTEE